MNPVIMSIEKLHQTPRLSGSDAVAASAHKTSFADLPLQARLLLAVPRVRGHLPKATLVERYVLDSLGRIIEPGPRRRQTIESVNMLSEVLLARHSLAQEPETDDKQWLSALENLVLCALCKIQNGHSDEAAQLTGHWLNKQSIQSFNAAASTLCNSECIKHGGPHVFTPGCTGKTAVDAYAVHRPVSYTRQLSLGELLLLNALRLRMRTLPHVRIANQVVPLLRENLALPCIEALLDALLIECLQYGGEESDVRCLCSEVLSVGESRLLTFIAAFGTGDAEMIATELHSRLPPDSAERLQARTEEFQSIVENLGAVVPRREWNENELSSRLNRNDVCEHLKEAPLIH